MKEDPVDFELNILFHYFAEQPGKRIEPECNFDQFRKQYIYWMRPMIMNFLVLDNGC